MAKTVFSTSNSSVDSLQDQQQHFLEHEQHTSMSAEELFNENLVLAQKNALAQQEVNSARNNQARLENQVFDLDRTLSDARKELQRALRAKKDGDRQLEQSNAGFERERTLWAEREAELMRSLKFATRPLVVQAPVKEEQWSNATEELPEALPPQIQQQITESSAAHARAMRAQEKLVSELRQQILALNHELIERQQTSTLRESELQTEVIQARELNRGLMEENESYQLLLHEKSMNGEFMQTSIMKSTGYDEDLPGTPKGSNGSVNLADELGRAFSQMPPTPPSERSNEALIVENKSLKDQNAALNLYITKILTRIMQTPMLTSVLAADYSPGRAAVPESPPVATAQANNISRNSGSTGKNSGSDSDSKKDDMKQQRRTETGRARSQSLLSKFSWSKPAPSPPTQSTATMGISARSSSTRTSSSSEDDSGSGNSTRLTSFNEGHELEGQDSPRSSYSPSEFEVVNHDRPVSLEYEHLTTFDKPFTRQELRLHATQTIPAPERHQRRQTISSSSSSHLSSGGHGRYVSESSAVPAGSNSQNTRRRMAPIGKSALPPMPEAQSQSSLSISTLRTDRMPAAIPEDRTQDSASMESVRSPTLSISTSQSSSTTNLSSVPTTNLSTSVGAENRKWKRWSMFGSSDSSTMTLRKAEDI
ncbi:hypothetical protein BGZ99_009499 [Dissophora globulifera]|uniref:Uncharacterized protein n=1 Tax=Dissophora globulifera TaxID=979702 RepID=A0A9P6RRH1_9FUNG|nr:hypothetical protein BGZ99_009499 [Dissophora globulifera]